MNATTLRSTFQSSFSPEAVLRYAALFGVVQRQRKLDLWALVVSLVLVSGSDDSGRQADVYSTYLGEADEGVVRSSFYDWFTEPLALLVRDGDGKVKQNGVAVVPFTVWVPRSVAEAPPGSPPA